MSSPAPIAPAAATAEEITKASKSNLALAFVALPPERRADISLFYAFCRIVDDITDEPGYTPEERAAELQKWRQALHVPQPEEPALAEKMRDLVARYSLPLTAFEEIILGCEMDIAGTHYVTWEALRLYCYRVASAVGLVSIEIFGCRDPRSKEYAVQLGLALQLTNILRDVGEDLSIGRIYLPTAEMEQHGYSLEDLHARRHTPAFLEMMRFQARRAAAFFAEARQLLAPGDRQALVAAEIMRAIYQQILEKMHADAFQVFDRRYRVNSLGKLTTIVREIARAKLRLSPRSAPVLR
jgi:15-cis-phytoene synthase